MFSDDDYNIINNIGKQIKPALPPIRAKKIVSLENINPNIMFRRNENSLNIIDIE